MGNDEREPIKKNVVLANSYIIEHLIGRGGNSLVYMALDIVTDQRVVIKELFPYMNAYREKNTNLSQKICFLKQDKTKIICFENEAIVLKKIISLEGLAKFKTFFYQNNTAYMVMEYVKGVNLEEWIQISGMISIEQTEKLFAPFIKNVKLMHNKNVIHRDICPENIIVNKNNQLILIDFGTALIVNQDNSEIVSSVTYRRDYSPREQIEGKCIDENWMDMYAIEATIRQCMEIKGKTKMECVMKW